MIFMLMISVYELPNKITASFASSYLIFLYIVYFVECWTEHQGTVIPFDLNYPGTRPLIGAAMTSVSAAPSCWEAKTPDPYSPA